MKTLQMLVRLVLFALILSLGTMGALVAGETQGLALANLSGVSVQAVANTTDGSVMYVGLTGGPQPAGVYRSEDRGLTWKVVSSGPGSAINALAVHPLEHNLVYAGTAGGSLETSASLWRSDNGGQTWHRFALGLPADPYGTIPAVTALTVDPARPDVLYVGTDGQGVYRFDVRRNGYELVGDVSLYNAHVRGLVLGPGGRLYALTGEGLYVSSGGPWQRLQVPEQAVSLAVAASDPQLLYIGGTSTGAFRSIDGGQSWEPISAGLAMLPGAALRVTSLAVDEQNEDHVVAATAYGLGGRLVGGIVYESWNAGQAWSKVAESDSAITQLSVDSSAIYAASAAGLARYGKQVGQSAQTFAWSNWVTLTNPTGVQVLILVLTVTLAGLALAWRKDWLVRRRGQAPC
jgi:photosystem II stability/assembly factor-like uncharacterized protein